MLTLICIVLQNVKNQITSNYSASLRFKSFVFIRRLTSEALRSIKDQLSALKLQNRTLQGRVDEEVAARKRLEIILKNNLLHNRSDIEWNNDV